MPGRAALVPAAEIALSSFSSLSTAPRGSSMTSVLQYRDPVAYRTRDPMSAASYVPPHMVSVKRSPPYDGHSSGSESKKQQIPGAKRRPSRAGTRSVSTLSAAQLERKRANDREAQRAIRQRTKDHIESLERQIRELTAQQDTDSSAKLVELLRRNEELEQENSLLRTRLSHTVAALGIQDQNTGSVMAGTDRSGLIPATRGAPSPSDRVQVLSQPRRSSTGTSRNVPSLPQLATPVSQPGHWQSQHGYPPNASSPHIETPQSLGEVSGQQDTLRWSPHPHPHQQHQPVSLPVQDPSIHAVDSAAMSYGGYGMDNSARSMSYPLEGAQLVTSQPMQINGYGTPTSNPSPHPTDYQRHLSVPMNAPPPAIPHPHPQQQVQPSYASYASSSHQSFVPQASHPGEMQMMAPAPHQHQHQHQHPHPQPHMMSEHGHMMYHMSSNMKAEH